MNSVIQYVAGFRPDFPMAVRGAEPSRITLFEQLARQRFPASYRDFLASMGVDCGGLNLSVDGSCDIEELIAYYQQEVASGECVVPDNCIIVGVGAVSVPPIGLDCRRDGEPTVVFTDGDVIRGLVAESLEKDLHQMAFTKYALQSLPSSAYLAASFADLGRQRRYEIARTIAEEEGFKPLWFADEITFCGERSDALLRINQYEGRGLAITIATSDVKSVHELECLFDDQLGIKPGRRLSIPTRP